MRTVPLRVGIWGLALLSGMVAIGCETPIEPTPPFCHFAVNPVTFTPCMSSTELAATLTTMPGCSWTAAPGAAWMTLLEGAAGSASGTIRFSITENWDAPRTGLVTIRDAQHARVTDVSVAQAGCRYAVVPAAFTVPGGGGTRTFDVLQQSDPLTCGGPLQSACRWSAISNVPWITVLTSMPRTGDDPVTFEVAPHESMEPRMGQITVRDRVVVVVQTPP